MRTCVHAVKDLASIRAGLIIIGLWRIFVVDESFFGLPNALLAHVDNTLYL